MIYMPDYSALTNAPFVVVEKRNGLVDDLTGVRTAEEARNYCSKRLEEIRRLAEGLKRANPMKHCAFVLTVFAVSYGVASRIEQFSYIAGTPIDQLTNLPYNL